MIGSKYDYEVMYGEYCLWCEAVICCKPASYEFWYMKKMGFYTI